MWCLFWLTVHLCVQCNAQSNTMTKTVIDNTRCLDGSPSAYYFTPGVGTGQHKWYVHHEGGGWCTSLEDCYERSLTELGSSVSYPPTMPLIFGYMSNDQKINPTMYNWNKVYIKYCDGGSFSGNNDTISYHDGHPLYFRGFFNLEATFWSLLEKGLKSSTDVVISGCSAGGLATFLHLDWWSELLWIQSHARVHGLPDSGFFLDYDSTLPDSPKYGTQMRWVFNQMNATSGVNQDCVRAHLATKDTEKCFFAEHTSPYIKAPIFPLQSEYDTWQTQNILGSEDEHEINKFGKLITSRLKRAVLQKEQNGVFLDSCAHHCGKWNDILIYGYNSAKAFAQWYGGGAGIFPQDKTYPCDACCKP